MYCGFLVYDRVSCISRRYLSPKYGGKSFEDGGFTLKMHQMYSVLIQCQVNSTGQQSPIILDLCLRKTRGGKSHDYRDAIVFDKLRF